MTAEMLGAVAMAPHTGPVPEDFVVARNPEPDSSLPNLLRLRIGRDGVVLKARDTWPRTAKVYCHRSAGWPGDMEVVERVGVRSRVRRGCPTFPERHAGRPALAGGRCRVRHRGRLLTGAVPGTLRTVVPPGKPPVAR